MDNVIDFLQDHEAKQPTLFLKNAQWRSENNRWLKWSQTIAIRLIRYMEDEAITRQALASRLDVTPQYVSKLLSGKVNFSFKSVAELEQRLGLHLLEVEMA